MVTSTPTWVLEEVTKRVDAFLRANKAEYTGNREVVYKDVQDVFPVRTIIFFAFQYTHSGERLAWGPCDLPEPCGLFQQGFQE